MVAEPAEGLPPANDGCLQLRVFAGGAYSLLGIDKAGVLGYFG
jgi:hypothetical protein